MAVPVLIILAGGASSRMWPLREKSLLCFGAEPLMITQLKRYQTYGFEQVVIVGNPENESIIRDLVAQIIGMKITVVVQPEAKGMGDALLCAESALGDKRDAAIYVNQIHDLVDGALHLNMLKAYQANPAETLLAGVEMQEYFPGGYLQVDSSGRITNIIEKPGAEHRPSNLVNIVAHIHAHAGRLLDAIRQEYTLAATPDDHYERAMAKLMQDSVYRVVPYQGHWSALKYPWHVLDIMDYFLSQIEGQTIAPTAFIAPTASISGKVVIGENVKVFPGAAVVGPVYIGAGTIVGNNSLVRASMVLDKCEVGFTTEIARSYIADHCAMHACRVLDSIFAPGVNFSAGCTTANLRIDKGFVMGMVKGQKINTGRNKLGAIIGENAFLGVDVMTMPGVKIGEGAQVGPGTHIHHDVQNHQRVYVKQELVVVDGDR
ncbi:MAG TPA: sugar phosphate nucleotidyltransferase [Phototrophicaceae bacterium]|jgi:bifunctional UDP-N-acetylglucosamine pyrophosphorylase/glucosamine-1-phosphate N-acetyltransferase|nr:sugar phosphate nucleotidyltransferase [Phototrophicaceae bacterium]